MTRGDFDPDVDWGDGHADPANPDAEGFEVMPPDMRSANIDEVEDVERELFDPHPGQRREDKPTDPDEWHH